MPFTPTSLISLLSFCCTCLFLKQEQSEPSLALNQSVDRNDTELLSPPRLQLCTAMPSFMQSSRSNPRLHTHWASIPLAELHPQFYLHMLVEVTGNTERERTHFPFPLGLPCTAPSAQLLCIVTILYRGSTRHPTHIRGTFSHHWTKNSTCRAQRGILSLLSADFIELSPK